MYRVDYMNNHGRGELTLLDDFGSCIAQNVPTQLKIVGTLLLTLEEDSWSLPDLGCVVQLYITKNHMLEDYLRPWMTLVVPDQNVQSRLIE